MAMEWESRIQFPTISRNSFPCCYSAQNGSGVTQLQCEWPFTSALCKDPDCRQLHLHAPYITLQYGTSVLFYLYWRCWLL